MAQFKKGSKGNTPKTKAIEMISKRFKVSLITARRYYEGKSKPQKKRDEVMAFVGKCKAHNN